MSIKRLSSLGWSCFISVLSVSACSSDMPSGASGGGAGSSALPSAGSGMLGPTQASGGSSAAQAGTGSMYAGASAAGSSAAGSSAGSGVGGSSGGSVGNGGSGGASMPCTDKQHPDHASEPCSIWVEWDQTKGANEPKDCDASWLTGAGYCLKSCGKCSDGTGGSGAGGSSTGGSGGGTGLGPGPKLPDVTNGNVYWASRYWDCCKPHCSQQGLPSCGVDGVSQNGGNSACSGGSAYACYSQAPRAIGDNVSYGYVAVPNPSCGTCYHLQFTGTGKFNANDPGSKAIAGKHMIVKVANTGGDVAGNQFDLAVPGGGVGINANTCTAQWKLSSNDLGPTAGGFLTACTGSYEQKKSCVREKCNKLPEGDARKGCLWFVDWFQAADDPNFRYEPISCPNDI